MTNVVDLQNEREINALIHKLGNLISGGDQNTITRTFEYLEGSNMAKDEQMVISVRLSESLVDWIEEHARLLAYQEKRRITRNSMIGEILEGYKNKIERKDQSQ